MTGQIVLSTPRRAPVTFKASNRTHIAEMLQFFALLLIIAAVAGKDANGNSTDDSNGNTVETDAWIKDAIRDLKFRVKVLERGAGRDPSKKAVFSGQLLKFDPRLESPTSLHLKWFNFMEGDDVRDGTAWGRVGGTSTIGESDFSIQMEMTEAEFKANITTHAKVLKYWKSKMAQEEDYEWFKRGRFAFGWIEGTFSGNETGSQGESARSDMHAVFYKRGGGGIPIPGYDCTWFNKLPEGFSCGRGAAPDIDCNPKGSVFHFDRYLPVPCDELVVKVANKRCDRGVRTPAKYIRFADLGNKPDCHTHVNWT